MENKNVIYSEGGTTWSVDLPNVEPEPFYEKPLKECTIREIEAKIEFLEKNILRFRSECEALELYSIKLQPDLAETNQIDVSWMPRKIFHKVPKTSKVKKRPISDLSTGASNEYAIEELSSEKKINKDHLIHMIQKVLMMFDIDCNKRYSEIQEQYDIAIAKLECNSTEHQIILQYIKNYKAEVLVYDPLTKKISSEKYMRFIKKQLMSTNVTINEMNLKIKGAINEQKMLQVSLINTKMNNISETDNIQLRVNNKKMERSLKEVKTTRKQIELKARIINQNYLRKKIQIEKDKTSLNLQLQVLDIEINKIKKKIPDFVIKKIEESDDLIPINVPAIASNTNNAIDNRIEHYIAVKNYIFQSDKNIKNMERKIQRQKEIMQRLSSEVHKKRLNKKKNNPKQIRESARCFN